MCICILSHFRPTVRHARGRACGSRGGLAWGVAVAIHRWMLREPGRCGGCQVVLCKFKNFSRNRCCDSCSAKIKHGRNAYHCGTCWRFECKQCTNASRRSSVPTSPRRPQLACGGCQGVLVDIRINYASVNRLCHSCSAAFEYINKVAYYCDSCERIICRQCTRAIRLAAWRRSGAKRCVSPVRGLTGIHGLRYSGLTSSASSCGCRQRWAQWRVKCARRSSNQWTQPVPMSTSGRRWVMKTSGRRSDTR